MRGARRIVLGLVVLAATGCGSTPTAPEPSTVQEFVLRSPATDQTVAVSVERLASGDARISYRSETFDGPLVTQRRAECPAEATDGYIDTTDRQRIRGFLPRGATGLDVIVGDRRVHATTWTGAAGPAGPYVEVGVPDAARADMRLEVLDAPAAAPACGPPSGGEAR